MPGNRPLRSDRLRERGARRRWPSLYRYRNGARQEPPAGPRLTSIDLDLLRLSPGDHVIDIGCGTGRHIVEMSRRPCYVVGVDRDPDELLFSKGYLYCLICDGDMRAKANLLLGEGDRLPFVDASFDRVVCTEVLEHVPDDGLVARELARVLRPGGTMAVSVPDHLVEAVCWRLTSLRGAPIRDHVRIYDRRRISALLRSEGLIPYASRCRHSLESLYWLLLFARGRRNSRGSAFAFYEEFIERKTMEGSAALRWMERVGDRVLPKSLVVYCRKPVQRRVT
jgi:SAM-dependent methyltransferase